MAAMLTALVILGAQLMQPRDPVDETIELACEAAERDDGVAAVQYLELALRRGKVDFDQAALRRVAEAAEELGLESLERGDEAEAVEIWGIAHHGFMEAGDRESAARMNRLLNGTP